MPWALILKFAKSPIGILAIVLFFTAALAGVQSMRLKHSQTLYVESLKENGKLEANLQAANDAYKLATQINGDQHMKITDLGTRLADLAAARAIEARTREAEIAANVTALNAARREADRLRRQVNADWSSTPSCQSLGILRVDTACPAIAQRLRERTAVHPADPGPGS